MLIVIGGASGAGKSNLARRINEEFDIPHYELDHLFNLMTESFQNSEIGNAEQKKVLQRTITNELACEFLDCFINFGVTAVIEGGWLSVNEVRSNLGKAHAVIPLFLGFGGTGKERLKKFQTGTTHWTVGKELSCDEEIRTVEFFDKQVRKSMRFEKDCQKHGLKYIDTTENTGFEEGFEFIKSEIERITLPGRRS